MPDESPEPEVTLAQILKDVLEIRAIVDKHTQLLHDLGLNGLTPYVKPFFEQYAATYQSRQAWITVRSDIAHRLHFLAPGKHWLGLLLAGSLGAIGWQLATSIHFGGLH